MYYPGDEVRFLYTGEFGKIRSITPEGLYMVQLLADGDVIPALEESIVLSSMFKGVVAPPVEQKKAPKAPKPQYRGSAPSTADLYGYSDEELERIENGESEPIKKERPTQTGSELELLPGSNSGLQIAFVPDIYEEGKFAIWLLNDTQASIRFDYRLTTSPAMGLPQELSHNIMAQEAFAIGEFQTQWLAMLPTLYFEAKAFGVHKEMKLKANQLFKAPQSLPLLGGEGLLFLLAHKLVAKEAEDISKYTERQVEAPQYKNRNLTPVQLIDLQKFTNFPKDIDLHIENLATPELIAKMTEAQMMALQLNSFQKFLAEAIRLGVTKIYAIHGNGKLRLRDEIHKSLSKNHYVKSYKNEYFAGYGFGATEILL